MPTGTTTYGFQKPTVGGDTDVWGGFVNDMMDKVDDILDGTLPITPAAGNDIDIVGTNAATNTVTTLLTLNSQSSGTPAVGIGAGLAFAAETGVGNTEVGAVIQAVTTDVTSTSEDFDLVFRTMAAGAAAAERMRVKSTGELDLSVGLQRGGVNAFVLRGNLAPITSGTAATYTPTAGTRAIEVIVIGGGGGGGGADGQGAGTAGAAGGGGSGGVVSMLITTVAASYTYTIGAGGTAGVGLAGADGGTGGNTTFAGGAVSITASGGLGGVGRTASSGGGIRGSGGVGGAATGGDINLDGAKGNTAYTSGANQLSVGDGASITPYGTGGAGAAISGSTGGAVGSAGNGFGAGGGGAAVATETTNYAGGAGAGGAILIREYF